jgi:large subunit ribosomal protein L25
MLQSHRSGRLEVGAALCYNPPVVNASTTAVALRRARLMDKLSLTLAPRTITGKKVKNLRKQGFVPAAICGKGVENANFQVEVRAFNQVYVRAGRNTLVELEMPTGTKSAYIRQVQRNPVNRQYIHVDFRIVDLNTPITADLPVVTVGENPLLEKGQGVLSLMLQTIHVRGLPTDLPQAVEIDVSRLKDFATVLHVRDLDMGNNVEVLTSADDPVATITASRMAEEAEEIAEQIEEGDMELAAEDADTNPEAGTSDEAESES